MSPGPQPPARPQVGPTDAALVVSARAGERWAAEALLRRHTDMAQGLAMRLLGRNDEAEDVVQDAFLAVLSHLDQLREPQAFAAFLGSVVVRKVRHLVRRRRLAQKLGLVAPAKPIDLGALVSLGAPPDVAAELRAIYRVLDTLPADERLALVLRRVEAMPLEEVASMLGCSTATAKRRIAAAEAALEREPHLPDTTALETGQRRAR